MAVKFDYRQADRRFYEEHLKGRVPGQVVDAHLHLNLPEHVRAVPPERLRSDWALEVNHCMSVREAHEIYARLLPQTCVRLTGMPWPIREADLRANNAYLARERAAGQVHPLMAIRPEWPAEQVERALIEGGFAGFKPYGDMVSGVKGADLSIFDFLPLQHLAVADRHRKVVLLHLPRRGRLADPENVRELLRIRDDFSHVRLIVAHFGRSFNPCYLREGLRQLGQACWFLFDCAAVLNPAVYELAFDLLSPAQILYGSDLPITLLRGRREWTERGYVNLTDGDYSWNTNRRPPQEEARYTLFLYEGLKALLDAMDRAGLSAQERAQVFAGNAAQAFGLG